ncbi:hypothetical protein Q5P01_004461 [Channa striata]|uniref:Chemokine 1 n=1 Tax=Channa striata TaxID=64152 RepID=V9NE62_CHASR|nr:chemokine 1 [Channa striata]KAK2859841.1 hypothetical protein Q5P01_004461 [Channa striata]
MVSCRSLFKSVVVAIVLVVLTESGSAAEKLATCCTKVTKEELTDPISGYLVQKNAVAPCVRAVIFQTDKGLFCSYVRAPWVARKIRAFEKEKSKSTTLSPVSPSGVSLLSIITSTASPSSSFTSSRPVFSSTSKAAVGETVSEDKE